jgi:cytochrome c oxidase cbb3-type subunit III
MQHQLSFPLLSAKITLLLYERRRWSMALQHDPDGTCSREEKKVPPVFRVVFFLFMGAAVVSGYCLFGCHSEKETGHLSEKQKEEYRSLGKNVFAERCTACHGVDAKGLIGADLTRKDFKYGKTRAALTETISKGRPGGMPAFGNDLSRKKIEGVVQYILSL